MISEKTAGNSQGFAKMEKFILNMFITAMFCLSCFAQDNIQLVYSIPEEQDVDTFIANIGLDANISQSEIRYNFLTSESEHFFRIDDSGALHIRQVIDRENLTSCEFSTICVLTLSVAAQSPVQNFFKKINVNFTVIDINDHSPKFDVKEMAVEILETSKEGSIPLIGAADADSGTNSLQRYYILHDSTESLPFDTQYEKFMDGKSTVKLVVTGTLDRESRDLYQLTLVAEDGGTPALNGTMLVNITVLDYNDNAPQFSLSSYNVTINEDIPASASILQLSATDPDLGENGEVVYKLSTNQLDIIHTLFSINESSGVLSMKGEFSSLSSAGYKVIVVASDKGRPQPLISQAVVMVTVIDNSNNPPKITLTLFSQGQVSEYANIGTAVGHIAIADSDNGANGDIRCSISSNDEVLTLERFGTDEEDEYKIVAAKPLDREAMDYIFVVVNCNDMGSPPLSTFEEFTVQVLDENDNTPRFLQDVYFVDVYENNPIDRELVQLSAIDDDFDYNSKVSYSLSSPENYQFSVDQLTGFVKTHSQFDRETKSRITFYAYATDRGSPALTSTATVVINVLDTNDNDPRFGHSLYAFNILENLAIGTSVGRIIPTDADIGENAMVGLALDSDVPFTIDPSGLITSMGVFDREDVTTFSFLLTAFDYGVPPRNSSATVVVRVVDENDNEPIFSFPSDVNYTVVMPAETAVGNRVALISATDNDEGMNAQLSYAIQNSNSSGLFEINAVSGEITLSRELVSQNQELFYLHIKVTDNGIPRKSSETSMGIFITRQEAKSKLPEKGGENLLIAITLGTVTFVLIFTIIMVICIIKRKGDRKNDDDDRSIDGFYEKPLTEKRVQFADITSSGVLDSDPITKATVKSSMTTFQSEASDENDFQLSPGPDSSEPSDSDKKRHSPREFPQPKVHLENQSPSVSFDGRLNLSSGSTDIRRQSPSATLETRLHSTPRMEQLANLQTHNALLHSQSKKPVSFTPFVLDDNHSESSTETATSDSGRGGSESDIHSASLSHDSENTSSFKKPLHQSLIKPLKIPTSTNFITGPFSSNLPKVHTRHRNSTTRIPPSTESFNRGLCTQSHSNFDRSKFVRFQEPSFPPPPSDLDRSYTTYDDEDDDCSTTTSGSYTIDHEDVSLDIQIPGLRGCLV